MLRALRGYHAGPAGHHAANCELFIGKACLQVICGGGLNVT